MIEILVDRSYEDDYFMISEVSVNIINPAEKERIEKLVKEHKILGSLVDGDSGLALRIADLLDVDVRIISVDTNEIDI